MTGVNGKRVFLVKPHVPAGYLDIVGKREDIRIDRLEHDTPPDLAAPVVAAAHGYQTSSTRDELARHFHVADEFLQRAPNLLLVSTNGAGYDTVDVKACTERGILVVNQAGGNAESVAEHVLGMMLMLVKRAIECDRALRAGTLQNRADFTGHEAFGKTIGIVGIGNVGRRVAELCSAL
jgi:D-3-phosphoglycerate dehydrogenase